MKAAFRLPRKRCPRVYLCARSSRSTSALLPSSPLPPSLRILAIPRFPLPFALRPVPPISHSLFLSIHIRASPPRPLPPSLYLFLCHIRAANFSSVFLLPIFLLHLSPSLPPPLTPAPLFLARFISARCQFEFGTRATGQRVSTKNQFLNARLFRAEGPACIFPSPASPPSALHLFVPLLPRFFSTWTLTPRRTSSSEVTELARPMTTLRYETVMNPD